MSMKLTTGEIFVHHQDWKAMSQVPVFSPPSWIIQQLQTCAKILAEKWDSQLQILSLLKLSKTTGVYFIDNFLCTKGLLTASMNSQFEFAKLKLVESYFSMLVNNQTSQEVFRECQQMLIQFLSFGLFNRKHVT